MGKLEKINSKNIRRSKIQEFILRYLAGDRRVTHDMLTTKILEQIGIEGLSSSRRQKEIVTSTTNRLRKRGLLEFKEGFYRITKEGDRVWNEWEMSDYKIKKPKKWDGKWRIIIFDIEEKKRPKRDRVRNIFNRAGLYPLQRSVWVCPYDCEDVIGLLKQELGVYRDVLYIIADQIENDAYLRKWFELSV